MAPIIMQSRPLTANSAGTVHIVFVNLKYFGEFTKKGHASLTSPRFGIGLGDSLPGGEAEAGNERPKNDCFVSCPCFRLVSHFTEKSQLRFLPVSSGFPFPVLSAETGNEAALRQGVLSIIHLQPLLFDQLGCHFGDCPFLRPISSAISEQLDSPSRTHCSNTALPSACFVDLVTLPSVCVWKVYSVAPRSVALFRFLVNRITKRAPFRCSPSSGTSSGRITENAASSRRLVPLMFCPSLPEWATISTAI